jgi:hypothetical protein
MTRAEHLAWCKQRALMLGGMEIANGADAVRRWINGFN